MTDINEKKALIRARAREDCLSKLSKFRRCALLGPTGYGKTWLASELTTLYSRVLYLYPSKVIRNTAENRIEDIYEQDELESEKIELEELHKYTDCDFRNVKFISYMKLVHMLKNDKLYELAGFDLVIMDEMHRIGAEKTYEAIKETVSLMPKAHILGITATPDRMDAEDVVTDFFGGITTREYTLHDAFKDGLIKKPYYCFCSYDVEKDIKHMAKEASLEDSINSSDIRVDKILKSRIIEIANIFGMDKILSETMQEVKEKEEALGNNYDLDYMKFIVFFDNCKTIKDKESIVKGWFEKAFPLYEVNTLQITSENEVTRKNVDKLEELEANKHAGKIDLIMCVNMLNEGYHVDSLTGILMYRGTSSSIVFNQQFGRALSSGDGQPCVVFDIVDNIHRKNVYNINSRGKTKSRKMKTKLDIEQLVGVDVTNLTNNEKAQLRRLLTDIGSKDISEITEDYVEHAMKILNKTENFKELDEDEKVAVLMSLYKYASQFYDKQWWKCTNRILPEDLHPTSHYAKYEEMLIKVLGEPLTQRCKRAGDMYFIRWCAMQKESEDEVNMPNTVDELTCHGKLNVFANAYARSWNVKPEQMLDAILKFDKDYMFELYKQVHKVGIDKVGCRQAG